ncbi:MULTISPECIES: VOC family protein [unclassified Ensifer]|uniref:VOC family protein n=1 Tax=unclassified Ensifer TaxID=2633371 RepID=UPI0008137BA5|nr:MULTISPECIES: VOC family protein [unclassified Ensifer]OCP09281.1 glyoxalase [Ensifer sp. LC13]OCP10462.1 glyoxalase [Ensifer sp. LC11]OCP13931.1 glyoxalase [Ensifer sp. LC14]OCP32529.1 glyoxalase [Ensifer sp. LC499]
MTVKRIVSNLYAPDPEMARAFYGDLLELEVVMDHGWILTFAEKGASAMPQLSVASEGGNNTPVPVLSIEVDDVDRTYGRAKAAGVEIVYDITNEPWGVRRFFMRDPFGNVVNILSH